jgi:hypothetical protein
MLLSVSAPLLVHQLVCAVNRNLTQAAPSLHLSRR